MIRRNQTFARLEGSYLFPEIERRKEAFRATHPEAELINLGIGDASLPVPAVVAEAMAQKSLEMALPESFSGYGPSEGLKELRKRIAHIFYRDDFSLDEVFVSDGSKSEMCRLQALLGVGLKVGVQNPVYPVFVDSSIIFDAKEIVSLPCLPENNFFPELRQAAGCDLIYFCSPNNPTGVVYSKEHLEELVAFAIENRVLIIYDAAYSPFIQQGEHPRSIYEIEGAKEVAIEVCSYSKLAGFTGIRLGWTIVPKELRYADGGPILPDWRRIVQTLFNGASRISQAGGLAALTTEGLQGIEENIAIYLESARILKEALVAQGISVFGGDSSPYIWAHFPGKTSWDLFEEFLEELHIVTIPGSGFGTSGEGFVRLSAFCSYSDAVKAAEVMKRKQELLIT